MININTFRSFFSRFAGLFFVVLLFLLAWIYDFDRILFLEPQSMHMWRQADCCSFALNYFEENRSFFEPSINYIGETGDGKTISDFPLIYFLIGNIWKITGQHEFIFRGFVLALFFTGLFLLYRTLCDLFNDKFWAMLPPLMLFTSPVLVYYSNNFLMNIPAFSLVLIGWHFFYDFYKSRKSKNLWISMVFFALAGLFKASSLLSFVALFGFFILESTNIVKSSDNRIFLNRKQSLFPFLMVIAIVFSWILFVKHYNSENNRDFFLVGILPIWEFSRTEIIQKFQEIRTHWIFLNYPGYFQFVIVSLWLTMLVFFRKNSRFFLYMNIILAFGVFSFLLLFYQVIAGHDYYWIDLFILLLMVVVSFIVFLKNNSESAFKWAKPLFAALLIFNVIYCEKKISQRYDGDNMNYYNQYIKDFSSMKTVNRQLGIKRDDLVISIPDGTINASLYLMDQKGWSTYGSDFENEEFFRKRIEKGAKYLFVSDTTLLGKEYLAPFIKHKITQHRSIALFSLEDQ